MPDASNGTTFLYTEVLESAFRKVRDIQEFIRQYALSQLIAVSVDDVIWAISEKYKVSIEISAVSFEAEHIRGVMERYQNNTAEIYVRDRQHSDDKQNKYWHRFISVKEACHLAIDGKEDWSPVGTETIRKIINANINENSGVPPTEVQSEYLAEIAATELLYPFEFRQNDIDGSKTAKELSEEHEVPVYVIEWALSPNHMKMASVIWSVVGGHGLGGLGSDP